MVYYITMTTPNRFEDFCRNFNDASGCDNAKLNTFIKVDNIEKPCRFDNGQCAPSCNSLKKLKSERVIENLPDFCNIQMDTDSNIPKADQNGNIPTLDPNRFKDFCEQINNVRECNNAKSDIFLANDGIEKPCTFNKKSMLCTMSCDSIKKLKSEDENVELPSFCK